MMDGAFDGRVCEDVERQIADRRIMRIATLEGGRRVWYIDMSKNATHPLDALTLASEP